MRLNFYIPVLQYGDNPEGAGATLGSTVHNTIEDLYCVYPDAVGYFEVSGEFTNPVRSGAV